MSPSTNSPPIQYTCHTRKRWPLAAEVVPAEFKDERTSETRILVVTLANVTDCSPRSLLAQRDSISGEASTLVELTSFRS
jgi:hypothetical protein